MVKKTMYILAMIVVAIQSYGQVSVTTQHNDLGRTGWNNNETVLTPANVNVAQFGKLFKIQVDDQLYAQPLIVSNLNIANAKHNVLFLATTNNTVYAADADNGTIYWSKNFTPAGQRPPRNTDMTGACGGNYKDIYGDIGIIGTPVIDSVSKTIYFVTRSTTGTNGTYTQLFHALDLVTGDEKVNSPVTIMASAPGNGSANVNGVISFDPQKNNQRQALTLVNGIVYVTFSSHCDWQPYHGWILGYNARTLEQAYVYNATANGYEAGLWQSGGGPAVDEAGNLYLVTGNGSVGYNNDESNLTNRGESAVKLKPSGNTLAVTSFFTPKNYKTLEIADLDYGSMAAFLIPGAKRYLTGCKDGNLYVLNTDNLGGFNAGYNNVEQTVILGNNATLRCQPSYYRSTAKEFIYIWSENSQLKAYPFDRSNNTLDVDDVITATPPGPVGANGALISTSSNNSKDGTGIVWASYASNGDANQSLRPGVLRAFDANDVTKELWNSNEKAARDAVGNYAKFSAPTIANGKVYLSTFSNQLNVYGIIDTTPQVPVCKSNTNIALGKAAFSSSNQSSSYPASQAFDGNSATKWVSGNTASAEWLYVDLGEMDSVCNVAINWSETAAKDFDIQISADAKTWKSIGSVTDNNTVTNSLNTNAFGRYVRVYCAAKAPTAGYSIREMQVFGYQVKSCVIPTGVTVNHITTTAATVRWNATNAAIYNVQIKPLSSSKWQTFTTGGDSLVITNLTCGNYYSYRVQSSCNKTNLSSYTEEGSFNTLTCVGCGLLPTRFYTSDIGDIAIGGQACFDGPNTFTIKGSGIDIGNNGDAFRYAYKTFSGNGRLVVRITSQDAANDLNKAGIMFRETLDARSRYAFVGLTSGSGAAFQYRYVTGATSTNMFTTGFKAPYYVALAKESNTYSAYVSKDSTNWTLLGSVKIPNFGNADYPIYAGLAVASHDNGKLSTVQFNDFSLVPKDTIIVNPVDTTCGALLPGIATTDIGKVSQTGSVCYVKSTDTYTLTGAGSDDIKMTDNFRYVYRKFVGDGYIDTRISALDSRAGAANEAGIMFRESLAPGSRNFFAGLTSGMGAFIQYRATTDASTSVRFFAGIKIPYYIRIEKKRDVYRAYISQDSTSWSIINTLTMPGMGTNGNSVYVGFAVNSHSSTKITKASFDRSHILMASTSDKARMLSDSTLSIAETVTNETIVSGKLKVYPNPTSNVITVDFTAADKQDFTIRIVGVADGRTYYAENISNFKGNYRKKFNNLQLPTGTYAVTIKSKNGIKTELFIKE